MTSPLGSWGLGLECCCEEEDKALVATTWGRTVAILDAFSLEEEFRYEFTDHERFGGGIPLDEAWNGSTVSHDYWQWWVKACKFDRWGSLYVSYLAITDTNTGELITIPPFTVRRQIFGVFKLTKRLATQEERDEGEEPGKKWRLDWIRDVGATWSVHPGVGLGAFNDLWWALDPNNRSGTIRIDRWDNIFFDHPMLSMFNMNGGWAAIDRDNDYWLTRLDRDGNIVHQYSKANTSINFPAFGGIAYVQPQGYYWLFGLMEFDLDNRGNILIHSDNLFYGNVYHASNMWPQMMLSYDGDFWNRGTGQLGAFGPVGNPTYINGIIGYPHVGYLDHQTDVLYCFRQLFLRSGQFTVGEAYQRVAEDGLLVWRKYKYFGNPNPSSFGFWSGQFDPPHSVELEYTQVELTEGLPCDTRPFKADAWDQRVAVIARVGPIKAYRNNPPPFLPFHQASSVVTLLDGKTLKTYAGWDTGQIQGDAAFVGDAQLTGDYESPIVPLGGGRFTSDKVQVVNICFNREDGSLYILWQTNAEITDEEQNPNRPPRINHRLYRVDTLTMKDVYVKALPLGQVESDVGNPNLKGMPENGGGRSWGLDFYTPLENPDRPGYIPTNGGPFTEPPVL